MAWLEIHQSIKDHRKLLAAADALDMAPAHVAGHIIFFWLWALDNAPSGEISEITARNIARAAQWEGSPESFLSALVESGLVDKTDEGLFIHDWSDYAGKLIDQRVADRERKRQSRAAAKAKNADSVTCPENVQRTSGGQNKDVQGKSVATVQNTTVQNTTAKNTRESNAGAPSCDEDISLDSNCNQSPANVPVNENENENEERETKTKPGANGAQVSDGFIRFWEAYPRKIEKKTAVEAWNLIDPDEDMTANIIAGLERWKQSKQWTDDNGQYIPYPASFLSKERWNDECQPAIVKKVPAVKNYDDDEDFLGTGGGSP